MPRLSVALFAFAASVSASELAHAEAVTSRVRGETSVYDDTNAVTVLTSAVAGGVESTTNGWRADASYLVDVVSAASVDVVATASPRWQEVRHAGAAAFTYKPGGVGLTGSGAVSSEPDYLSVAGGGRLLFDLADKTVNPSFGYSYVHDTAGRRGTPFSVLALDVDRHGLSAGLELVLDRATVLWAGADIVIERGRQEKPYRWLPVFAPDAAARVPPGASFAAVGELRLPARLAERLPDERHRYALSARLSHKLRRATLVVSARAYADDWSMVAVTTDVRVVVQAAPRLELWPHLRVHGQSSVGFWSRAYTATVAPDSAVDVPAYRSGDRELGALITGTAGGAMRLLLGPAERPRAWSCGVQLDLLHTRFRDALYLRDRSSVLGAVDLQVELP